MNKQILHLVRLEAKEGNKAINQAWAGKCSVSMLKAIETCIPKNVFVSIRKAITEKKAKFKAENTPESIINQAKDLGLKYALFSGLND